MAIIKNDIPILEYDDCQTAVLNPDCRDIDIKLPERAVFAFLADLVDRYALSHNAVKVYEYETITKNFPVYILNHNGEEICLCQAPLGGSAAVQILDWMICYGVKKVIATGSCGALIDFEENTFLVPKKALRDEGASYHYLPPSRFVEIDSAVLDAIKSTLESKNYAYTECVTWTTDGFYRETKEKVNYRKQEGCTVVDMECASMAACAQFRGAKFGQILFTADTLADVESYDERDWGVKSFEKALELALDTALAL
ncbi:MAG: nucleoside phosphorylase [Oscillospiraceae bacterium]|nr:nucleoside phosphorylase [Oscillospiraceae bacterium]